MPNITRLAWPGYCFLMLTTAMRYETAFGRQVEVDDLRILLLQDRHEHLVERYAQHRRLVRRLAGVGAVVDRVAAHGDALDGEHRKFGLLVVIAGVVAVGAFQAVSFGKDDALQHDLGRSRYLQIGLPIHFTSSVREPRSRPANWYSDSVSGTGVTAPRMVAGSAPNATATGYGLAGNFWQWSRKSSAPPRCASQRMISCSAPIPAGDRCRGSAWICSARA